MGKFLGIVAILFSLLHPTKISAKDYKTSFHVIVITEDKYAESEGNNQDKAQIPISDTLKAKGWICGLTPRAVVKGTEYVQTIECINTANGSIVGTFVHCSINNQSSAESLLVLDDKDPAVKSTNFNISCNTVSGDRI